MLLGLALATHDKNLVLVQSGRVHNPGNNWTVCQIESKTTPVTQSNGCTAHKVTALAMALERYHCPGCWRDAMGTLGWYKAT
ncbi:hypothetical protein GWK47_009256 [Chionoecetes opilio]|uniref:Uncharacterized protein n=1 Tax=Chionoecetes opilio TaxID=41210 RepID=A0A8J4Y852_CHIOP|nr:hypothetical protein GWK47_009256 [Chionoecetes opilio]